MQSISGYIYVMDKKHFCSLCGFEIPPCIERPILIAI